MHYTQRDRLRTFDKIRDWIKDLQPEDIWIDGLIRKCVLFLGCTPECAKSYIQIVMGDDYVKAKFGTDQ